MATRSLTEVFILMRNNAMQNRHIFSEQTYNDRSALVSSGIDIESGFNHTLSNKLPPEWIDGVEEVQYEISRIKQKWKELSAFHDKHMNRPTLDDSVDEEHAIEIQTREITQMFSRCQRLVQQISAKGQHASSQEQKVTKNVISSLARTLTELSSQFRSGQSTYLRKLKSREERSSHYFETDSNAFMDEEERVNEELYDRGFTDVQLRMVEDNTVTVQQREKEIAQIVHSIQDLNEIFKDLAAMVIDQGTILDRIDYNLEQTQSCVESGLQQLKKAENYQKKNRKMICILGLAVVIILLIVILIAVKH